MKNISILKIIPIEPLPFNSPDYFLYFSSYEVNKGSIVKCELRNKKIYGYVYELIDFKDAKKLVKDLEYQLKNIEGIFLKNPFISEVQEVLASWISKNYGISLAHSFYFFLSFYKKIESNYKPSPTKGNKFEKIYLNEFDKEILNNKPVLIITPTESYAKHLYENLKKEVNELILLDLDERKENFNKFIQIILNKEDKIFIGSKNSVFLPWQKLNSIVIYKEGDIFYKEFFKIPSFNYLNIIEKLAKILKTKLIIIDKFPSLKTIVEKKIEKPIKNIDFDTFSTIFELTNILEKHKNAKVFVPTKLTAKKMLCNICFYEFNCPKCNYPLNIYEDSAFCRICFKKYKLENRCPNCGSNDLYVKGIGANWLKKYLEKEGYFVYLINKEKDIDIFTKQNYKNFVLIGSLYILNPFLPKTESAVFINFDFSMHSYNPFLKEKFLRILIDLKDSANYLYIHTNLKEDYLEKIKNFEILNEIIKEREVGKLPPFYKIYKIISRLRNLEELNKRMLEVKEILNKNKLIYNLDIEINGPFLERIPKKINRYQLFLTVKTKKEIDFRKLIENINYIEEIRADEEEI